MSVTLLLGGQKSGKSRAAATMATSAGAEVVVIAPAEARDAEFAARIQRHRDDRPADWTTLETFAVASSLARCPAGATVIVDALDTWLLDAMDRHGIDADESILARESDYAFKAILSELDMIAEAAVEREGLTIFVAGQPGMGPIGATWLTRRYVDLHGLMCTRLALRCDRILLVVAGRVIEAAPP